MQRPAAGAAKCAAGRRRGDRIGRLKNAWRELRQGEPGRRFRDCYRRRHRQRRHPGGRKWSTIIAGALLLVVGVPLLPLPGPGMLVIALGAFLIAGESLAVASALDWLERRARALFLRERSRGLSRARR